MPDLRRVHRFRDHPIEGVNWRPTRFVDEVPSSRVCGLCRMIPKRTVLLPCSHALCQPCHAASSQGACGRCPLDREPFEEAQCSAYDLFARNANTFKVHCWNEEHGCDFEGTVQDTLRHYESACTFHVVECPGCGEGVKHKDLPTHYVAGCRASVSSTRTENTSSESTALTLQNVRNDLEEVKALLREPSHDQLLPVVQGHINELTEQVRNQESRLAEVIREVGASVMAEMARVAASTSSTLTPELASLRDLVADEASASSPLLLGSEKMLILRKLEHFASMSLGGPEASLPASEQCPRRVVVRCTSRSVDVRNLTSSLPSTLTWTQTYGNVSYVLSVENCDEIIACRETSKKFAQVNVLHMRDTYFTVAVWKSYFERAHRLTVEIAFCGLLAGSQCLPPVCRLAVLRTNHWRSRELASVPSVCQCKPNGALWAHFHRSFWIECDSLQADGFLKDSRMEFKLELSHAANPQAHTPTAGRV